MKNYRVCGKIKRTLHRQDYDTRLQDDAAAQAWAKRLIEENPSFLAARLVEVIAKGEYREIPLLRP